MSKLFIIASGAYFLSKLFPRRRNVLILADQMFNYPMVNYFSDKIDYKFDENKNYDVTVASLSTCCSVSNNLGKLVDEIKARSKISYFLDFSEIGGVLISGNNK